MGSFSVFHLYFVQIERHPWETYWRAGVPCWIHRWRGLWEVPRSTWSIHTLHQPQGDGTYGLLDVLRYVIIAIIHMFAVFWSCLYDYFLFVRMRECSLASSCRLVFFLFLYLSWFFLFSVEQPFNPFSEALPFNIPFFW